MSEGYYIIIRGPLGVGKSTISEKLKKQLNAELISIDHLLEKYKDEVPKNEWGDILLPGFIAVNNHIKDEIEERLKKGQIFIFDGNFYYKEALEDLISKLNFKNYVFTLKASLETCMLRNNNRSNSRSEIAAKGIYKITTKFDYGINIQTEDKSIDEVVKEIKSYL